MTFRPSLGTLATVVILAVMLFSAGCGGTPAGEVHISIKGMAFHPSAVVISPGTKVVWTNDGDSHTAHTSTSSNWSLSASKNGTLPATAWNSMPLNPGESYSRTFDAPGDHGYFCMVHPYMKGTVTVR